MLCNYSRMLNLARIRERDGHGSPFNFQYSKIVQILGFWPRRRDKVHWLK